MANTTFIKILRRLSVRPRKERIAPGAGYWHILYETALDVFPDLKRVDKRHITTLIIEPRDEFERLFAGELRLRYNHETDRIFVIGASRAGVYYMNAGLGAVYQKKFCRDINCRRCARRRAGREVSRDFRMMSANTNA